MSHNQIVVKRFNLTLIDIVPGDSGSLVVTKSDHSVVGHVVSSNSLKEAYVVPIKNTFRQIERQRGLPKHSVHLPSNLFENRGRV